jgi:signal transduction histidine kinase
LRRSDWLLGAVLSVCVSVVVVGLAARAGLDTRPPEYNIYEPWQFAVGFPCVIVGAYVAARAPRHPLGWLFVAAGGFVWASPTLSATFDRGWLHPGLLARVAVLFGFAGWVWCRGILLALVPLVYPGGIGRSTWRRLWFAVTALVVFAAGLCNAIPFAAIDFSTGQPWDSWFSDWLSPLMRAVMLLALIAQIDLLVRVATMPATERRRHLPVAVAAVVLLAPSTISMAQSVGWLDGFDHPEIEFIGMMLLPAALAVGLFRYDALGFHTVVRRGALYAGVTLIAAALYVPVVWLFSVLVQDNSGLGPVVATGVVAVSLQPARALVQRLVDRWVFGDRDEPYRALSGLSRQLGEGDGDPLAAVASVVRSSLRLDAVTIEWDDETGERVVAARAGDADPTADSEHVPIMFEGHQVATLAVTRSTGAGNPTAAERRLLMDLAGAAGAVVQSARAADELARSRGLIVRAREEERRRLRHDLHDGLGPTLASVALGLDAAAGRIEDRDLASLLRDLDQALQEAIADIRRLVAGLRPPALDDLGLVPALREQAVDLSARSQRADGTSLAIRVDADPALPPLTAAVEVAAYRIAVEGMTNALRHASASECHVRLSPSPLQSAVEVVVEDDGLGIDEDATAGIGLESMRSRAEELGGRLRIGRRMGGGTVLAALLPLHEPAGWATA